MSFLEITVKMEGQDPHKFLYVRVLVLFTVRLMEPEMTTVKVCNECLTECRLVGKMILKMIKIK